MSWITRLIRRRALERDLDRELRFHLDSQIEDYIRLGLPAAEARRRALIELGGVEPVKEASRDSRGTRWVEDWWTDTRYGLRGMARSPGFTLAAVLTLAIGIGANTAVWSIVDALMWRSLPIERPEELHAVRKVGIEEGSYIISHPTMRRMRAALPDSTKLAAMSSLARMYVVDGEGPEAVITQLVSGNWFALLGVGATAGRTLGPQDDQTLGGHPVVVLSDRYWRRRYGGDRAVVGRTVRLNGVPVTVAGIAEPGFGGLTVGSAIDVWAPLTMQHELRYRGNAASTDSDTDKPWIPQAGISWLTLVVRAAPRDARAIGARLDVPFRAALEASLTTQDSAARAYSLREHAELEPLGRGFSFLRQQFAEPLRVLMTSVALVLLIACGNLAGLLLARSMARHHEIAVRVSLGARPGRLVRQLLTESVTLALIGGAASLVVAHWGTRTLLRLASTGSRPVPLDASLDGRVLLLALGATVGAGILFGLAPALRVARTDLYEGFKASGRVAGSRLPLGRVLVVSQIALSLLLVTSAALFVRTFQNLVAIEPGYDRESVVTARLDVLAAGYTSETLPGLEQRLLDAVRAVPGVHSVSLSKLGLAGGTRQISGFTIPGRTLRPGENAGQENYVTPAFFETVGMELVRGRGFTDADRAGAPRVAIISETAARHFFGADDVIGARFGYGTPPEFEVVGVVRDARVNGLQDAPERLIFYPLAQGRHDYITSLEARVTGSSGRVIGAVRRAIRSVDANLPVRDVTTLGDLLERGLWIQRLVARLASAFGVLALVLAGIGLYGVISYSVARRTNEMGVRLALGASQANVRWLVLRDSLTTVAFGVVLGLVLWYPALQLAERLVYGLSPHDAGTLGLGVALLLLVSLAASALPAWRASLIDPLQAIRAE